MMNASNKSCYDLCANSSHISFGIENANCEYFCNDTDKCLMFCPSNRNNVTGNGGSGDLLVLLEKPTTVQGLLFLVGNIISMTGLVATVLVHAFLKKQLWSIQGQCLTALTVSLFFAKLAFQVNPYFSVDKYLCSLMSVLQHYFCMSAFLWLSVLIYNVWKFTSHDQIPAKKRRTVMLVYVAYAWGTPSMAVITCVVVEFLLRFGVGYGNARYCSILGDEILLYSLAVPLGVIALINTGLFVAILVKRARKISTLPDYETMTASQRRGVLCAKTNIEEKGHSMKSYFTLSVVMSTAWLTGFAASNKKQFCSVWFCDWWIFFVILNCLQGVYIFMNFSLNSDVYALLQEKCYIRMRRLKRSMKGVKKRPRLGRARHYKEMNEDGGTPSSLEQGNIQTVSGAVSDTSSV